MQLLPDQTEAFAAWEAKNRDPYGACIFRYAVRWGDLMEAALAEGKALEAVAAPLSHEADTEGITGFMYGAAVVVLARAWVHGEALRRWHNLTTQLHDEGERANETGGILNPAVIAIR